MLYSQFGSEFYAGVTLVSLAFGRYIKGLFPGMPERMLPWIVMAFAFVAVAGDRLLGGATVGAAASAAFAGLISGAVAVGMHESLKGPLGAFSERAVRSLLGKLGKQ